MWVYRPSLADMSNPLAVGAFKVIPQTFGNKPVTMLVSSLPPITPVPSDVSGVKAAPPEVDGASLTLFFIMKALAAPSKETSQPS